MIMKYRLFSDIVIILHIKNEFFKNSNLKEGEKNGME